MFGRNVWPIRGWIDQRVPRIPEMKKLKFGATAKRVLLMGITGFIFVQWPAYLRAQTASHKACNAFAEGSIVPEPEDLRSLNGELTVDLTIQNDVEAGGSIRYCYTAGDGKESPNLRLNPGDLLILNLKNDLKDPGNQAGAGGHHHDKAGAKKSENPCVSGLMTATSTNLHFHGLTIPPSAIKMTSLIHPYNQANRRFDIVSASRLMSPPDCIGITPISMDSVRSRFWEERQERSSWKGSSAPARKWQDCPNACSSFAIGTY